MSVNYTTVLWNTQKKWYDLLLWGGILLLLFSFAIFQIIFHPDITIETLIIRATAVAAFTLLHFILLIGPLCRLDSRFLPLLYNRRHLGVSMFLLALVHGVFSIIQFHALGDTFPLVSIFTSNQNYQSISEFPFQTLGFFALLILFLMAATSHDFWLKNLGPKAWKNLHMGVYFAYALIIVHVATGALQYESHPAYWALLVLGFALVAGMHLWAAWRERQKLAAQNVLEQAGFYEVGPVADLSENCGKPLFINGENIAVFKYEGKVSAVNNVCKHQMGPIGEGKIIDGCITCPWHGYQYLPENGQSPPPFNEKLTTYEVKVLEGIIWVNPHPKAAGTYIAPAKING